MANGFKFDFNATPREGERIEKKEDGTRLKKYGGTETSWPTVTKVQLPGMSHKDQERESRDMDNISTFFNNL